MLSFKLGETISNQCLFEATDTGWDIQKTTTGWHIQKTDTGGYIHLS